MEFLACVQPGNISKLYGMGREMDGGGRSLRIPASSADMEQWPVSHDSPG